MTQADSTTVMAALDAYSRGYVPMPLLDRDKIPGIPAWTRMTFENADEVKNSFTEWGASGKGNIGIVLGDNSGGLVDVDLDHPKAVRMKDYFLPHTLAKSGREGRRGTHYWYICEEGTTPGTTRQHLMPRDEDGKRGEVAVELRSTKGQTAIPPSIHPSGESYLWEGQPWGGAAGPAKVNGRALSARVAMLGLAAVLLDNWPQRGTRHEAYVALAGGLLSYGELGVHPFWGRQANAAEQIIRALADATLDDDGADARVEESVYATIRAIEAGKRVRGLGSLVDIIGERHVQQVRVLVAEVEAAAGFTSRQAAAVPGTAASQATTPLTSPKVTIEDDGQAAASTDERDPLYERLSTWQALDLEPYLTGQISTVMPSILTRLDGKSLMYPGRVNMLYGSSETAKSWIALYMCMQVMSVGERVVYIDFEDEPVNTLNRLELLGAGHDDIRKQFTYIRPEDPIASMQRDRWGKKNETEGGMASRDIFLQTLDAVDPTLIIADGMSVIYGLHGLNTNDTVETDVITSWLKSLTRNGRSTVTVIDHTGKGAERGSLPIGSQHKTSMVQGTLLQAWPLSQPRPGAIGEVELILLKDRPGEVRRFALDGGGGKAQVAALVRMDSLVDGIVDMTISEPLDPVAVAASGVMDLARTREAERQQKYRDDEEAIKRLFRGKLGTQLSMLEVSTKLPEGFVWRSLNADGKWSAWKGDGAKAMKRLIEQGWVMPVGNTRDRKYELVIGSNDYDLDPPDPVQGAD